MSDGRDCDDPKPSLPCPRSSLGENYPAVVVFGYKESVLALLVGLLLLLWLPHPWNGVGFAVAITWELVTILYCLWWSQRQTLQVGTSTLLGLGAVVVTPCTPRGRVRLRGETWQARSEALVMPGTRVRVCSVEGLTLHVEPEQHP
jgi:membrane protein implicated in regulation of membrane protease activity